MFRCDAWWCLVPTSGSVCLLWIFCGMLAISTDTLHFVILRPPEDMDSSTTARWKFFGAMLWNHERSSEMGPNISHLGKRNIIFKHALGKGYVSSQKGNCSQHPFKHPFHTYVLFWGWSSCRLEKWPSFSRLKTSLTHGSKQSIITQVAMCLYIDRCIILYYTTLNYIIYNIILYLCILYYIKFVYIILYYIYIYIYIYMYI